MERANFLKIDVNPPSHPEAWETIKDLQAAIVFLEEKWRSEGRPRHLYILIHEMVDELARWYSGRPPRQSSELLVKAKEVLNPAVSVQ